jgi:hypothetical protein
VELGQVQDPKTRHDPKQHTGIKKQKPICLTLIHIMPAISDNTSMTMIPAIPLPATHALRKLGPDLALAGRKRGLSTADIAGRLFISRDTLWR